MVTAGGPVSEGYFLSSYRTYHREQIASKWITADSLEELAQGAIHHPSPKGEKTGNHDV
jgi:hypothetical protein